MITLLAEIEQQACTLSPDDRAHLAEVLLESLRPPSLSVNEAEWEQEIERRVAAFDSGELKTYPAEEIFADARCISSIRYMRFALGTHALSLHYPLHYPFFRA